MDAMYVLAGEERVGPFTLQELREHVEGGRFTSEHLAWAEGMEEWAPLGTLLEQEEEAEVIAEGAGYVLTREDMIIGQEIFSLKGVLKATVEVEHTKRARPVMMSIIFGFLTVLTLARPHNPENTTQWVIWGVCLTVFGLFFLRNLLLAFKPTGTFLAVHLTNGDDRILQLKEREAKRVAGMVNELAESSAQPES